MALKYVIKVVYWCPKCNLECIVYNPDRLIDEEGSCPNCNRNYTLKKNEFINTPEDALKEWQENNK